MLMNAEHPVAWAMLMYELSDAHEHLGELITQMNAAGEIDEPEFYVYIGHVYAHLNRAWHGRNDPNLDQLSDEKLIEHRKFPTDLQPSG